MSYPTITIDNHDAPVTDDTDAVVLAAGEPGKQIILKQIVFAYDIEPISGMLLKVEAGAVTVMGVPVTKPGPGVIGFPSDVFQLDTETDMTVTLVAGGAGVSGSLTVSWGYK